MFSAGDSVIAATAKVRARALLTACASLALIAAAGPAAAAAAPAPVVPGPAPTVREGVAAVVNDEIISTYDLRQRTLLLIVTSGVQVTQDSLPGIEREALRQLIDERLQMQEVRRIEARTKVTLEPDAKELTQQVERLAQQNGITGQQLIDSLGSAGVDQGALAAQLHAEISWQRYVGGRFGNVVKIGDDQIAAAMKRAEAASAKAQYQVAEIFVDAQRAGGQAQALAGAQQLVQQLQQGAPFTGVARQFSSAPSASSGGDAGWMVAGDMPPQLEAALEQMRPGQLSQPIPVSGGVYILLLRDKRAGQGASLVSLKQAALRLASDAPPAEVQAATAKLDALRPQLTSCAQFEAEAGKVDGVVAGDLGEADINDLTPSFRDAISGLQIGQVSAPVRTNAGLHLVALCGKRSGGPNAPTRDDIENRLAEQELVMISRRELRNLRNSASIENK
jgi:peptidyl-prolyl cis-trans isomerase SurA